MSRIYEYLKCVHIIYICFAIYFSMDFIKPFSNTPCLLLLREALQKNISFGYCQKYAKTYSPPHPYFGHPWGYICVWAHVQGVWMALQKHFIKRFGMVLNPLKLNLRPPLPFCIMFNSNIFFKAFLKSLWHINIMKYDGSNMLLMYNIYILYVIEVLLLGVTPDEVMCWIFTHGQLKPPLLWVG